MGTRESEVAEGDLNDVYSTIMTLIMSSNNRKKLYGECGRQRRLRLYERVEGKWRLR